MQQLDDRQLRTVAREPGRWHPHVRLTGGEFQVGPGDGNAQGGTVVGELAGLIHLGAHGAELGIVEEVVGGLTKQAVEGRVIRKRLVHGAARRHHREDDRDDAAAAAGPTGPAPSGQNQAGHHARHAQPYVHGPGRAGGDRLREVKPGEQDCDQDEASRNTERELLQHVPAQDHRDRADRDRDPGQQRREPATDDRDAAPVHGEGQDRRADGRRAGRDDRQEPARDAEARPQVGAGSAGGLLAGTRLDGVRPARAVGAGAHSGCLSRLGYWCG